MTWKFTSYERRSRMERCRRRGRWSSAVRCSAALLDWPQHHANTDLRMLKPCQERAIKLAPKNNAIIETVRCCSFSISHQRTFAVVAVGLAALSSLAQCSHTKRLLLKKTCRCGTTTKYKAKLVERIVLQFTEGWGCISNANKVSPSSSSRLSLTTARISSKPVPFYEWNNNWTWNACLLQWYRQGFYGPLTRISCAM